MIRYLTERELVMINTLQIQRYSPEEKIGVKEPTALNMCVALPKQDVFDKELSESSIIADLIEGTPKHVPITSAQPTTPLKNGSNTVFPNPDLFLTFFSLYLFVSFTVMNFEFFWFSFSFSPIINHIPFLRPKSGWKRIKFWQGKRVRNL